MKDQQLQGLPGLLVDRMIRRSVSKSFHTAWWLPPVGGVRKPAVFVANHHGWYDGYLMYLAATRLQCPSLMWIEEYDAFPLFGKAGGMPFPRNDPIRRAITIRQTLRLMQTSQFSLVLFAEGKLHRPPEILKFGRTLEAVCAKNPSATVVPVALRYEMSMHERPEVFLSFGEPVEASAASPEGVRLKIKAMLDECAQKIIFDKEAFEVLAVGTKDVNERWDMRKLRRNPLPP